MVNTKIIADCILIELCEHAKIDSEKTPIELSLIIEGVLKDFIVLDHPSPEG